MKKTLIIIFLALSVGLQGQTFSSLLKDRTGWFNVVDYGATTGDTENDADNIRAAVTAAAAVGGTQGGGTERERPVPVARLTPKKDEYKVGDKVTVDVPPMRNVGNPLSEDRLKEIEERRKAMREEMESRRAEVLKMRDERRKGFEK